MYLGIRNFNPVLVMGTILRERGKTYTSVAYK